MKTFRLLILLLAFMLSSYTKAQDLKLGLPLGHSSDITTISFSHDQMLLATGSADKTAKIWNLQEGKLIHNLKHTYEVTNITFSPDRKKIVIATGDNFSYQGGKVYLWDVETGSLLHEFSHSLPVISACFSSDGNEISTYASYEMWEERMVFNAITGKQLPMHKWIKCSGDNNLKRSDINKEIILTWKYWSGYDSSASVKNMETNELYYTLFHNEGITSAIFSPDGKRIVSGSADGEVKIWDAITGTELKILRSQAAGLYRSIFSPDGRLIASTDGRKTWIIEKKSGQILQVLAGGEPVITPACDKILTVMQDSVKVWSLESGRLFYTQKSSGGVFKVSPSGKFFINTRSSTDSISVIHTDSGNLICTINGHTADISSDDQFIIAGNVKCEVLKFNLERNKVEKIKPLPSYSSKDVYSTHISPYLNYMVTTYSNIDYGKYGGVSIHRYKNLKIQDESYQALEPTIIYSPRPASVDFSRDATKIATTVNDQKVTIFSVSEKEKINTIYSLAGHYTPVKLVVFSPDDSLLLTQSSDNIIRMWRARDGAYLYTINDNSLLSELRDPKNKIFSPDSKTFLTVEDASFIVRNSQTGEILLRRFIMEGNHMVTISPEGYFDASPEAMQYMYWTKGLDVIDFHQLKDRYWIPGLWEKVMNGEKLPKIRSINQLKMNPQVELGQADQGTIPVKLIKRDGGYGEVAIYINGKEIAKDARGTNFDTSLTVQNLLFDIRNHPFLQPGENTITVKASSADGFVQGKGASLIYTYEPSKPAEPIEFFAVVVGVGQYNNPQINLKYTINDARSIASAVKLGAEELFGKDQTHVYSITSDGEILPTKTNIESAFKAIAKQANSQDIILVYLSGHGITWGGDMAEFYFLTSEATASHSEAYNDAILRQNHTISTAELTEWLKSIPSLKQVMIIDACGSGQAVDNLLAAREMDGNQLKAIDRMKDRTGMFIISGCAADAVSYEASQYGQGLLTYTLLQGMKGAALKEDTYIDVSTLLEHARNQVPVLASGIGGIQQPQLLIPKGGSFDIGMLTIEKRAAIKLSEPKKVFVRSVFQDEDLFEDALGLAKALDNELNLVSSKGPESPLVFFDAREYPNACKITGRYIQLNGQITLRYRIRCGENVQTGVLSGATVNDLVMKMVDSITLIK